MSKIVSFLKSLTRPVLDHYPELRDAITWDEHVAAGLRLELKHCPICKSNFRDHRYASFASIRIGKGFPSAQPFLDAIKKHEWDALMKHQSGKQDPDNAEACVIGCPIGGLAVLLVHTPFEPWDYASIDFCEVLKPEEGNAVEKQLAGRWRPLDMARVPPAG